ncbi:hypothetical protein GH5_07872 [Leishmania sp. Ghana 2012 LV757]|uniref:hypothetical protein n=1 Tax=Leishmania sp. Ghana 2012 LV757 TaxID=2803181 RepID=UPI001B5135BD|nr:hypothetical protein GH5_07872 [Leishmania sp. Ghana 2012 LV757]
MKSLASLPLAALLFLLTLSGVVEVAQAQGLPGLLALQIKGYVSYSSAYLSTSGVEVTYDSTEKMCFDAGGVPASDTNAGLSVAVAHEMRVNGGTRTSTIYTGASAEPSLPDTKCKERTTGTEAPNSANCYYRWRYGFYDMYSYNGEPGTAYWANLYMTNSAASQVLNQFEQFIWNPAPSPAGDKYPRGYYGAIASLDAAGTGLYRMDAPLTPNENDPNPKSQFMIVCEYQLYPERPPFTTRLPQPQFVNGFKSLTWSQSNWWVIFMIFAIIILAFLTAIVLYCYCTSTRPKEEPPLFQMVIRERFGKAYIISDGPPMAAKQPCAAPGSMPPPTVSPEKEEHRRQLRCGRSFNPQQRTDEEDMSVGMAGIFDNGERRMYAAGSVIENAGEKPVDSNFEDIGEDAFPYSRQPSGSQGADGSGSTCQEPSLVTSKRRSVRRSRNHTTSRAFSDVDIPQAGEIDETNVDL